MQIIIRLVFISAVILTGTTVKGEIVAADWTTSSSGNLNGISFTFSAGFWMDSYDFSGPDYSFSPLSTTQETALYSCKADWKLEFNNRVDGLLVYLLSWRGDFGEVDPVTYTFDSPFSIQSGLSGASISGNTLILPGSGGGYYNGIIKFAEPLTALNVVSNSESSNMQGLTVAYDDTENTSSSVLAPLLMLLLK